MRDSSAHRIKRNLLFLLSVLFLTHPLPSEASLYGGDNDHVQTFSSEGDFKKRVLQSDNIWLMQFYAPWCGHCKGLVPAYKEVSNILRGIVSVGAVDASDGWGQRMAPTYQVQGFPTLKIFTDDKKSPKDFKGERNLQGLIQGVLMEMQQTIQGRADGSSSKGKPSSSGSGAGGNTGGGSVKDATVKLTTSNFKEKVLDSKDVWMVAFIAPWCGHCKNLLPNWTEAAGRLDGQGVFLGVVDATEEESLAQTYKVQGYPTIKVFPGGAGKTTSSAQDYEGGRETVHIVDFAIEELERSGAPPEIPEMTGPDVLKEYCDGPNRICVLSALPHILESMADGRNKYVESLQSVAKKFRGKPFHFLWFEGSSQPQLEEALEMTFGFPAVVALSMEKNAYAVLRSSFSDKNIGRFLSSITSGAQSTVKLNKLPEVVKVEPWDGLDGEPIEEESLADIMGWDDDEPAEL